MLANEKLYEMKVPNNIVLNPKDGYRICRIFVTPKITFRDLVQILLIQFH